MKIINDGKEEVVQEYPDMPVTENPLPVSTMNQSYVQTGPAQETKRETKQNDDRKFNQFVVFKSKGMLSLDYDNEKGALFLKMIPGEKRQGQRGTSLFPDQKIVISLDKNEAALFARRCRFPLKIEDRINSNNSTKVDVIHLRECDEKGVWLNLYHQAPNSNRVTTFSIGTFKGKEYGKIYQIEGDITKSVTIGLSEDDLYAIGIFAEYAFLRMTFANLNK